MALGLALPPRPGTPMPYCCRTLRFPAPLSCLSNYFKMIRRTPAAPAKSKTRGGGLAARPRDRSAGHPGVAAHRRTGWLARGEVTRICEAPRDQGTISPGQVTYAAIEPKGI